MEPLGSKVLQISPYIQVEVCQDKNKVQFWVSRLDVSHNSCIFDYLVGKKDVWAYLW